MLRGIGFTEITDITRLRYYLLPWLCWSLCEGKINRTYYRSKNLFTAIGSKVAIFRQDAILHNLRLLKARLFKVFGKNKFYNNSWKMGKQIKIHILVGVKGQVEYKLQV